MRTCLEQMNHAEHEPLRLAADADRVRVDVERVRRIRAVLELHVACVHLRTLRERIRVADFPLVGTRVRALREAADALAVYRAALAVAEPAVERVPRAGTHRDRTTDAPCAALQVAGRRVVLQALV